MKGDGRYGPAAAVGSPCVFVDALGDWGGGRDYGQTNSIVEIEH